MYTQEDFIRLAMGDKLRELYINGEFILAIRYYKFKINLYKYNNYLVEVFYDHKLDRISQVLPFSADKSRMKFYADQIKLPVNLIA